VFDIRKPSADSSLTPQLRHIAITGAADWATREELEGALQS
jgi:hypothetical protein